MDLQELFLTKPQKTMLLCAIFIAGLASCFLNAIFLAGFILILLVAFGFYKKVFSLKFSVLCIVIFLFSIFYLGMRTPEQDKLSQITPAKVCLQGRVVTEPKSNLYDRTKFEFAADSYRLKNTDWDTLKAKTLVNIYDKNQSFKNISIGDEISLYGFIKQPFEATNPGQFDYKNYLKNQGIYTITSVKKGDFEIKKHPEGGKWFLIQQLNKIKNRIIDENSKYLKSPKLEIFEGMVLGDYAVPVPDETKQEFIKSGLSHLLAASGMNVGFIFGFWFFIATWLKIPYKAKMIAGAVLVGFYSIMTGLPPSVMRATFMTEFLILGKLLDRKADTLILLVFVCALMLLINPLWIANIGFQLSFLTTFGILLCTEPLIEKVKPVPEVISGAVLVPLIAQIWASPIQIFHFNTFSSYALIANILVLPFAGIITFAGFIGNIFSLVPVIGSKLCWISVKIAEPFINIILFVSSYTSKLPHAVQYCAQPEVFAIIVFYLFVINLLFAIKNGFSSKKLNLSALILALILIIFAVNPYFDRNLKIVVFDVGQGDSILVHTPDNKNILVDTGPVKRFSPAKSAIIPYFRDNGIKYLDAIILTHQDSDHIGGTGDIIANIPVKIIFHNGFTEDTRTARKLKKLVFEKKIPTRILSDGDKILSEKNLEIRAIQSSKAEEKNDNDESIVLYILYKEFSGLLMADEEAGALGHIAKHVKKPVDFIKVGHHGSYNSVDYSYLDYLRPQLAVISVGKAGYRYGHPNEQVLEELKSFNIETFRTDKNFAVTVVSDGNGYFYKTFKKSSPN
jgi:competence protein ComEC